MRVFNLSGISVAADDDGDDDDDDDVQCSGVTRGYRREDRGTDLRG